MQAESNTVTIKVGMTCGGCSGAVTRVLGKLDGACEEKFAADAVAAPGLAFVMCQRLQESQTSRPTLTAKKLW